MLAVNQVWEEKSRPGHTVQIVKVDAEGVLIKHIGVYNKRVQSYLSYLEAKRFKSRYQLMGEKRGIRYKVISAGELGFKHIHRGIWIEGAWHRIQLITHGVKGVTIRAAAKRGYYGIYRLSPKDQYEVTVMEYKV